MDDLRFGDAVTGFGHQHQAQAGVHLLVDLAKIWIFSFFCFCCVLIRYLYVTVKSSKVEDCLVILSLTRSYCLQIFSLTFSSPFSHSPFTHSHKIPYTHIDTPTHTHLYLSLSLALKNRILEKNSLAEATQKLLYKEASTERKTSSEIDRGGGTTAEC